MNDVTDFLAQRRLALVGLSRQPQEFSRAVFRALCDRGYDVVPVNPALDEADGRRAFARVQDIAPPVSAALLMTSPAQSAQVVRDCLEAGIDRIWLHQGAGPGSASPEAVALCEGAGVRLVSCQCPLMFLPEPAWFHRAHAAWKRLRGTYPTPGAGA